MITAIGLGSRQEEPRPGHRPMDPPSSRSGSAPIGCVGIQLTDTESRIRAEDGTTVPQGSRGDIRACGFWQRSECQS
ncbi:hypothetical protein [Streptomyces sp. NBC_00624]|uniref:hypothetical protein n=1 Tax=Streptomyces sp. NBC_00624 TaxID=2975791 RepID=UPI0030E033E8